MFSLIRFGHRGIIFPVNQREQTRKLWLWFWALAIAACSSQALCQDAHDYVPNLPYTA